MSMSDHSSPTDDELHRRIHDDVEELFDAWDDLDGDEFATFARIEAFSAEMSGAPMSELITQRGRVPDDLAPILEQIIEYRRLNPGRL